MVLGWWDDDPRFKSAPELPEVLGLADQAEVSLIGMEEFLEDQKKDAYCRGKPELVGDPGSPFDVDRYGFLIRKSPLDGSLQRVVPKTLQPRVVYICYYPLYRGTQVAPVCNPH